MSPKLREKVKHLAEESPYAGERQAAREALKRIDSRVSEPGDPRAPNPHRQQKGYMTDADMIDLMTRAASQMKVDRHFSERVYPGAVFHYEKAAPFFWGVSFIKGGRVIDPEDIYS